MTRGRHDEPGLADVVREYPGRVIAGVAAAVVLAAGVGALTVDAVVADAACAVATPPVLDAAACFDIVHPTR